MNTRACEWEEFSKLVANHIKKYAGDQYGDLNLEDPEKGDVLQKADISQLQTNMQRYVNRMTTNSRGKTEALRDLLKLAHYCAIAWGKYERNEVDLYNDTQIKIDINESTDIHDIIIEISKQLNKLKSVTLNF